MPIPEPGPFGVDTLPPPRSNEAPSRGGNRDHPKQKGLFLIFLYNNFSTHPKFNIAPRKWWLEDYFPIGKVTFQELC